MGTQRKTRAYRAAAVLLGLLAALLLIVFVLRPPCLILRFTGLVCPGCGTQRMILALLRGDLSAALGHNGLLLFLTPAAGVYAVLEAVRYVREQPPLYRSRAALPVLLAVTALAVAFMVLRNLPGFEFLGP